MIALTCPKSISAKGAVFALHTPKVGLWKAKSAGDHWIFIVVDMYKEQNIDEEEGGI